MRLQSGLFRSRSVIPAKAGIQKMPGLKEAGGKRTFLDSDQAQNDGNNQKALNRNFLQLTISGQIV